MAGETHSLASTRTVRKRGNCAYFYVSRNDKVGYCHREPSQVYQIDANKMVLWPKVCCSDWCGQYRSVDDDYEREETSRTRRPVALMSRCVVSA